MKKVLIINLGWEQEPLIKNLHSRGMLLFGVHGSSHVDLYDLFEEVLITDIRNLDVILDFAHKIKPDAVISDQCDYSHFAQAIVAEHYHLPGPKISQAQISSNKFLQRTKAKEAGVCIPDFKLIDSIDDVYQFAETKGFPFILKPIDNRGSFGVSKVENKASIELAYENAIINSHSRLVIAEQFIAGVEITVDGYCFKDEAVSLTVAKKGHINESTQVSVDIKYPGEFNIDIYERILKNNEDVISKLGYSFGMTHAEYMLTNGGDIYLIEAANRGGGVFTSEIIVPQVSGVDILSIYIDACLGYNTPSRPDHIEKNETILKFFSFKPGEIRDIIGLDALSNDSDVLKFRLSVKPGDIIQPISTDANRHGFIIVSDVNVRERADRIMENIIVDYK